MIGMMMSLLVALFADGAAFFQPSHHHFHFNRATLRLTLTATSPTAIVVAEDLMTWLVDHGATLNGVSIQSGCCVASGLGLVATTSLEIGHEALQVPRRAQLRADSNQLHELSRALAIQVGCLMKENEHPHVEEASLAAALLSELSLLRVHVEHAASSKWQYDVETTTPPNEIAAPIPVDSLYFGPYLESLPSLVDMPQPSWLWKLDDDRWDTRQSASRAQVLRRQMDAEFQALQQDTTITTNKLRLASGEFITEPLWHYARTLVMSRAFDIGSGLALVPGIDATNHAERALWEVFVDDENEKCVLLVDDNVVAGQEVFISYGTTKSNQDLLLYYGFSLDEK